MNIIQIIEKLDGKKIYMSGLEGVELSLQEAKINELVEAVNRLVERTDFIHQDMVNRVY